MRFDEPKEPKSYFWQRAEMREDGFILSVVPDYLAYLNQKSVAGNPRLVSDLHVGEEHYILNPNSRLELSD